MMTMTVELPLETGELVEKALDRARDSSALQTPELSDQSWSVQQADALVSVVSAYLSGNGEASACTSGNYQVTIHVDRSALAQGEGRSSLPIESVKRLCCDGDAVVIVEKVINNPSAEGLLSATRASSMNSPPP